MTHAFRPIATEGIDTSGEFGRALRQIESSRSNYFITGKAGTGKSTLLRYFVENTKKRVVLLAPTGIAAVNVGGETIHSFFKFPPRTLTEDDIRPAGQPELYRAIDTLVIDEVSMVRADLMDAMDNFMRLNGRTSALPFGGIQVLLFGDLFQLQPVVSDGEEERFFSSYYASPYFFDAKALGAMGLEVVNLTKPFRHNDPKFIRLLDSIRFGQVEESLLDTVNQRYQSYLAAGTSTGIITLTATNRRALDINEGELARIPEPEHVFEGTLEGEYPKRSLPTEMVLRLKRGAQVMFVKNDARHRWVNGTIARIASISDSEIHAEISSGDDVHTYKVAPVSWEILKHKYDSRNHAVVTEVVGSFTQVPLRLAWAVTIHKSQGLTFDNVIIDMDVDAFAHGQTYVALSRSRTLDGISLRRRLKRSDVIVDAAVLRYYRNAIGPLRNDSAVSKSPSIVSERGVTPMTTAKDTVTPGVATTTLPSTERWEASPPVHMPAKPPRRIPAWAWWGLGAILFVLVSTVLSRQSPGVQPTAIVYPTELPIAAPYIPAVAPTATQIPRCVNWAEIVQVSGEQGRCVYGIVTERRRVTSEGESWFLMRFNAAPTTFYVISRAPIAAVIGDCAVVEASVRFDPNGAPFMETSNIEIDQTMCSR